MNLILHTILMLVIWPSQDGMDNSTSRLSRYLKHKNLDRLELRSAEIDFARELNQDLRKELAENLAIRYRDYLLRWSPGSNLDKTIERAKSLSREFPSLFSSELRIALVHARYTQAEFNFVNCWMDGKLDEQKKSLVQEFNSIQSEIRSVLQWSEQEQQNELANLPFNNTKSSGRSSTLDQIESRIIHANYLMGWTNYFQAVIQHEIDLDLLHQSKSHFYRALQIEQKLPIDKIDSKWLDFTSTTSQRTLIGLGMVYTATRENTSANFCFENSKLNANRQLATQTRFNSYSFSRQWAAANKIANNQDSDESSFWNTVLQAGLIAAKSESGEAGKTAGQKLQKAGLLGLLRNFDADSIDLYLRQSNTTLRDENVFDLWIQGLLAFHSSTENQTDLEKAKTKISACLRLLPPEFDPTDKFRIKYLLSLIEYRLENYDEVLAVFPSPPTRSEAGAHDLLEKICWLRCRCLVQKSQTEHRKVALALSAMNHLLAEYPETELKQKVEFFKLITSNLLLSPEQAISRLQKIPPSNPHFTDAQFEIIKNQFRHWHSNSTIDKNESQEAYQELLALDREFRLVNPEKHIQALQSIIFILDASLKCDREVQFLDEKLDQAMEIATTNKECARYLPKIVFCQFLVDQKYERHNSALKNAWDLFENSGDKSYEIAALKYLAQQSANSTDAKTVQIHQALSERLGNTVSELSDSINARVAANRLVKVYLENNQFERANTLNQKLLAAASNQKQFVHNAARISQGLGNLQLAKDYWLKLARGSSAGSELWLEAKFELIKHFMKNDESRGTRLLIQTLALAGEMPDSWRKKYDKLKKEFLSPALQNNMDDDFMNQDRGK